MIGFIALAFAGMLRTQTIGTLSISLAARESEDIRERAAEGYPSSKLQSLETEDNGVIGSWFEMMSSG